MKKKKVYFGKRKLTHHEGMHKGTWVVPRQFRLYFSMRRHLHTLSMAKKVYMNMLTGVHDVTGVSHERYIEMAIHRRKISKALQLSYGFKAMQDLLNEINLADPTEPQEQQSTMGQK